MPMKPFCGGFLCSSVWFGMDAGGLANRLGSVPTVRLVYHSTVKYLGIYKLSIYATDMSLKDSQRTLTYGICVIKSIGSDRMFLYCLKPHCIRITRLYDVVVKSSDRR